MKIDSIINFKKRTNSKKGWMRIVEAFIAIILIMTVMVVVIQRQRIGLNSVEEIQIKQRNIINMIARDDVLRSEILSWTATQTNEKLKYLIPAGYNYSIELCNYNAMCSLNFTPPTAVFSEETIIISNLTYYVPNQAVKLKLFFWKGPFPEGQVPHNYSEPLKPIEPVTPIIYCPNSLCDHGETWISCPADCPVPTVADIFVSKWETSQQYLWYSPTLGANTQRINWTITISNNNPVDWTIKTFTECWANLPPADFGGLPCKITNAPAGLIVKNTAPWTRNSYAATTSSENKYNFTYAGTDANGNTFSVFKEIQFS